MLEIVIKRNDLQSHRVEAGVPQCSPVSPILYVIHTAGLIQWVVERAQAEGLSFIDNLRWGATKKDVNQVVEKLGACAAESIKWASRRDLRFATPTTEAAHLTGRSGHNTHLRPKHTAKIMVENGSVQFNNEVTQWLGV